MNKFSVIVSYSQLAVFDAALTKPFNNWLNDHVAQGFSWRHGSVSFKTLTEGDQYEIDLVKTDVDIPVLPTAIRVIQVPFDVSKNGLVEVASISGGVQAELIPGEYALRFECYPNLKIRLVFVRGGDRGFKILREDDGLSPRYPLRIKADPV